MPISSRQPVAIFVERSTKQWIVRDHDGNFWIVPVTEQSWERRQPFEPTEGTELEPVPGHYKSLLGLSFLTEEESTYER